MSMALHCGQSAAALAWVVPHVAYPGMWRVRTPDGRDMANLTRAKDAAVHICARGPPVLNRNLFRWKVAGPLMEAAA
jgi:hypothetical protein